jgi:anti-anti-sigma regulatory factor
MLRISRITRTGDQAVLLRLEAQVTGRWTEELRRVCSETISGNGYGQALVLDLAGVSFIDANGVALLRDLAARHVRRRTPRYLSRNSSKR